MAKKRPRYEQLDLFSQTIDLYCEICGKEVAEDDFCKGCGALICKDHAIIYYKHNVYDHEILDEIIDETHA